MSRTLRAILLLSSCIIAVQSFPASGLDAVVPETDLIDVVDSDAKAGADTVQGDAEGIATPPPVETAKAAAKAVVEKTKAAAKAIAHSAPVKKAKAAAKAIADSAEVKQAVDDAEAGAGTVQGDVKDIVDSAPVKKAKADASAAVEKTKADLKAIAHSPEGKQAVDDAKTGAGTVQGDAKAMADSASVQKMTTDMATMGQEYMAAANAILTSSPKIAQMIAAVPAMFQKDMADQAALLGSSAVKEMMDDQVSEAKAIGADVIALGKSSKGAAATAAVGPALAKVGAQMMSVMKSTVCNPQATPVMIKDMLSQDKAMVAQLAAQFKQLAGAPEATKLAADMQSDFATQKTDMEAVANSGEMSAFEDDMAANVKKMEADLASAADVSTDQVEEDAGILKNDVKGVAGSPEVAKALQDAKQTAQTVSNDAEGVAGSPEVAKALQDAKQGGKTMVKDAEGVAGSTEVAKALQDAKQAAQTFSKDVEAVAGSTAMQEAKAKMEGAMAGPVATAAATLQQNVAAVLANICAPTGGK